MANTEENQNGIAGAEQKTGFEDKAIDELKTLLESETDVEAQKNINRELFGRAKRAEDRLKNEGSGGSAPQGKKKDAEDQANPWDEYAQLQAAGYSPAEIVELGKLAKTLKISPLQVLENPIVKAGFEATRKKATVGTRTLPPDRGPRGSATPSQGKESDTPGIKSARDSFNRSLSTGDESSE